MAGWIQKRDWQLWFTGTFRPERRIRDTINAKLAFYRWLAKLNEDYQVKHVEYFIAVERFKSGYDTHIHAVLNGLAHLPYKTIGGSWRGLYGREQIEKYRQELGADYYLTKYITKDICDWDFNFKKK
jgi:hypothetical protein